MAKRNSNRTAKILYWHGLALVFCLCIAASLYLRNLHRFDTLIIKTARSHNMDPRLLSSLIWKESRFNPASRGRQGEIGLMQLMDGAVQDWARAHEREVPNEEALFNPVVNLEIGTWYLARGLAYWSERVADPIPYALAEYNAGRANVQNWLREDIKTSREFWHCIEFPGTRRYVRDILERYRGGV